MSSSHEGAVFAAAISLLVGTVGGYAINELLRIGHIAELEEEIGRLKAEAQKVLEVEVQATRRRLPRSPGQAARSGFRNASLVRPCPA